MNKVTHSVAKKDECPWYSVETDEVFARVESSPLGLAQADAMQRLARFGPNRLRPQKGRSPLVRFLVQFHNVLIYILLVAGVVTLALGHWVDAGVIFGVVLVNALIGFIQEGKAERALEAVKHLLSVQATVLRDGTRMTLPAEQIVPGDIIQVQSGDRVPADARLFRQRALKIDESMLTGESVPADKTVERLSNNVPVGDRRNMLFSGTLVASGQGSAVVVATGDDTEIGRISTLLAEVRQLTTPLLRQMTTFGQWLTAAILAIATLTFAFGVLLRDYSASDMFMAAVGLAVAAIPEGLPAIITITLAIGVQRMARRNAIIRRLPAVETLGSVTVICSDKTGTLTCNEMTVRTVALADQLIEVTGSGYDPHGGFQGSSGNLDAASVPDLGEVCRAGMLCNDSSLRCADRGWQPEGDPTEAALIALSLKAGIDANQLAEELPRTDVIPFESEHRLMATLHHDHEGHAFVYLKGAPEVILTRCEHERRNGDDHPLNPRYWHRQVEDIARKGQRTLALAFKPSTDDRPMLRFEDTDGGFTLLGLVGIIDPPRDEAIEAVQRCRSAGIRVKMITGDHAATAGAIASQFELGTDGAVTTGVDLDEMSSAALATSAEQTDVFARTSPQHKLRLVEALQAAGEVVAMTGDGVNDAPALKRADVGVAMGIKGTETAKEAAEMVLADDNFASITHAVEEGRTVYDNIRKAILFILPTNGGEALTILAAIALGRMLPVTPAQILWVNMITAVTLALAIAFEPPETDVMRRPPRSPRQPLLDAFMGWRIAFVSLLIVSGTFGLFLWERMEGAEIAAARTIAVNTLVVAEAFYLLNTRYFTASAFTRAGLTGNRYILLAIGLVMGFQLLFTYTPVMQALFATAAIDINAWARIILVGAAIFFVVELEKGLLRWRASRRR